MATAIQVRVSEYLKSHYEPDAEYVDGVIEERPMGELDHNRLQKQLLLLLSTQATRPYFESMQGQRVQVATKRFRVPDLCLLRLNVPAEQITTVPPILCIEILSPEDTIPRTMVRINDFLAMGVPQVWIFDPVRRAVHLCSTGTSELRSEGILQIPETPITLSMKRYFQLSTHGPAGRSLLIP